MAIAGQTFYLFTVENLKQFGTLKAMGASNSTLIFMIVLQAVVVASIGYCLGVGAAVASGHLDRHPIEIGLLHALADDGGDRRRGDDDRPVVERRFGPPGVGARAGDRFSRVS